MTFKGRSHDFELVPHVAVHLCRRYGERVMTDIYAVARKIAQVLVYADRRFCMLLTKSESSGDYSRMGSGV
jgi:hypothetical protein